MWAGTWFGLLFSQGIVVSHYACGVVSFWFGGERVDDADGYGDDDRT